MSSAQLDSDATLRAMLQLAAGDRATLALIYFHGHTQAEVATELGLSRSEVGRRVSRGLLDLGERLHRVGRDAPKRSTWTRRGRKR
ncbi:RNA polymerase sigma factor [uncultured Jatrophihabitans sp.]|uniref:RNA polymerase sigma factor n=1 Tax=uncultured Jatrophihabitans sp. TaxID=1610747 RepID=UPI0035C9CCF9